MEVYDAETGERLIVDLSDDAPVIGTGITATSPPYFAFEASSSPNLSAIHAETQSRRQLGDSVAWRQQQLARMEKAERRFRQSMAGIRHELERKDLSDFQRRALEVELLDKMKQQYQQQIQMLVQEEIEREVAREVQLRMELSAIGKQRLRKRHDQERTFYKAQIERIREECELSLTAAVAQRNLLR